MLEERYVPSYSTHALPPIFEKIIQNSQKKRLPGLPLLLSPYPPVLGTSSISPLDSSKLLEKQVYLYPLVNRKIRISSTSQNAVPITALRQKQEHF